MLSNTKSQAAILTPPCKSSRSHFQLAPGNVAQDNPILLPQETTMHANQVIQNMQLRPLASLIYTKHNKLPSAELRSKLRVAIFPP